MHLPLRLKPTALALAAAAALCAMPTWSATLTADPTAADGVPNDDKCSLREAVMAINAGAATADCANSVADNFGVNDTINLPAGTYTLTTGGVDETYESSGGTVPWVATITADASRGDLDITKSVKIVGAGSATTTIQWSTEEGQTRDRIFHVFAETGTIDVQIQGVKLTNGQTLETLIAPGATEGTSYYLRRAGGAIAVGAAANVVLFDPSVEGRENSEGRGGSKRPTEPDEGGATFSLTLTDVVVDSNSAQGDGGGIYTAAAMTATNVVVSNNTSTTNGGGIYNEGNTTIAASTIKGNTAEGGGGFFGTGSNVVNIAGVTFSDNHAVGGGAISGRAGVTMRIVNSTISGNTGSDVGAGLYTNGVAELRFVTIANNVSGGEVSSGGAGGSGINTFPSRSASVTVKNVLLADNKVGWDGESELTPDYVASLASKNCGGTGGNVSIESRGHNLSSDTSCADIFTVAGDLNKVDPKLGPLADNGGPTQTHALAADSPALGAGEDEADITVDQRGERRDSPPDIGAFELPAPTDDADGGGGGGCTTNPNAKFDGGLLGLLAAAFAGLALRRRRKA
ncbi:choice-of-anchor Q domain-containing protein [Azohydromonas sediminis]|uniref:choice-of-anchor Q domain-containing protein n=1 Tax=Azohydromonas sediminis TaxID=2259674 RepID=UPI000E64BD4E|nr:choice-of-anchor Q domain-containing protein [Azohydromonas sediminis]